METTSLETLRQRVADLEAEQDQIPLRRESAKALDAEEYDQAHKEWVANGGVRTGLKRPDNPRSNEREVAWREQELPRLIDLARLEVLEAERGQLARQRSEYRQTTVTRLEAELDQADAALEDAKEQQREAWNALSDARLREQRLMSTEFKLRNNANVIRQRYELER